MAGYFLSALVFLTILSFSIALPPAVEEITEGVEKSLIANHRINVGVYSEQLARLILDGETVLSDQAAEDKTRIPIYYGVQHEPVMAAAREFIDKPLNILKPREFPEEPFDHIFVHNYGFGDFCNPEEEKKTVRGIASLASAYRETKDPAILSAFEDKARDPSLDERTIKHRKLVRGIFSKLSGEEFKEDKDDSIDKSVDAMIADHNAFSYMDHLKNLIDNAFLGDGVQIPFKDSPYNHKYFYNDKPPADRTKIDASGLLFSWINQITPMSKDNYSASPFPHVRRENKPQSDKPSKEGSFSPKIRKRTVDTEDKRPPSPTQESLPVPGEEISDSGGRSDRESKVHGDNPSIETPGDRFGGEPVSDGNDPAIDALGEGEGQETSPEDVEGREEGEPEPEESSDESAAVSPTLEDLARRLSHRSEIGSDDSPVSSSVATPITPNKKLDMESIFNRLRGDLELEDDDFVILPPPEK